MSQANLTISYNYNDRVSTTNESDQQVFSIERRSRDYQFNFSQPAAGTGNAVNSISDSNIPVTVTDAVNSDENASRIYLKGGSGFFSQLRLFDEDEILANQIIEDIRANNWIINEANLEFFVDRETLDASNLDTNLEPPRLYLYNSENNFPLYNALTEVSDSQTPLGAFLNYDGILQKDGNRGDKYKIRITEYLNNIIIRDSANVPLNLTLTSDINRIDVAPIEHVNDEEFSLPVMATINPLGTVLLGNNVEPAAESRKLKLRLFYTVAN